MENIIRNDSPGVLVFDYDGRNVVVYANAFGGLTAEDAESGSALDPVVVLTAVLAAQCE